jgi:hypothetical protein
MATASTLRFHLTGLVVAGVLSAGFAATAIASNILPIDMSTPQGASDCAGAGGLVGAAPDGSGVCFAPRGCEGSPSGLQTVPVDASARSACSNQCGTYWTAPSGQAYCTMPGRSAGTGRGGGGLVPREPTNRTTR